MRSTDDKIKHWDSMYDMPLENIPWEIKDPPKDLVELLDSGKLYGGRALDIACGTGNYSFYMAQHGFSEKAAVFVHGITHALQRRRNSERRGGLSQHALHEGEAYNNQFTVLDYYWDGKLSRVVELNNNQTNIFEIETGSTGMDSELGFSAVLLYPVAAAIRNTIYGYTPGSPEVPDRLVKEYTQLGLLKNGL